MVLNISISVMVILISVLAACITVLNETSTVINVAVTKIPEHILEMVRFISSTNEFIIEILLLKMLLYIPARSPA
jgi:hypothetical protein